jgi:hypothetical protein
MVSSAPSDQQLLLIAITRVAAVALLISEALILWFRRREPATDAITAFGRLFWAVVPAAVLLGLSLWCATDLSPARPGAALAEATQLRSDGH